jgi:hypothetical protein
LADNVVRTGGPLGGGDDNSGEAQTVVGQPLGGGGGYQGPPPGAYGGPQTDIYGTVNAAPKVRYRELPDAKPVKNPWFSTIVVPLLMFLVVVGIGVFVYSKFILLPRGPMKAMRLFVPYSKGNDIASLQTIVDQKSLVYIYQCLKDRRYRRSNNLSFDFFRSQYQGFDEGKQWKLKILSLDAKSAKILVMPGPEPIDEFREEYLPPNLKQGFPFTLVKEGVEWKVDLVSSIMELQGVTLNVPLPANAPATPAAPVAAK